jgi:hypothetical protein
LLTPWKKIIYDSNSICSDILLVQSLDESESILFPGSCKKFAKKIHEEQDRRTKEIPVN